ncbi:hypothetical protein [Nocardia africana]
MSSNEPRDQLAAIAKRIRSQAVISTRPGQLDELERISNDLAALELEFAGWRPPARVIKDPAELDRLSSRSIVITPEGYIWRHDRPGSRFPWRLLDGGRNGTASNVLREGRQSVTVLHEPEAEG